ncbi:uncharacterized protein LOC113565630 [Drosophila persimilis]|uniref:uncharacterized protein LOC113565630 n=1 Tax=Drosophila persimilis TaxID=7234 RepID=UPI000F075246|nr:uncharacterized protein LOC113565630 [Drosophila persimilis]
MESCILNHYEHEFFTIKRISQNFASFYEYSDALPKYSNEQIGKLSEGVSFTITGKIAINCERFSINLEFKYKVSPEIVDTVYIQGDLKLWNVTLEHNPMVKGKNVRIYHNPMYYDEY